MTTEEVIKLYKLVEGLPSAVEAEVNYLMLYGWDVIAPPFPRINADGVHLVVQPMKLDVDVVDELDIIGNIIAHHLDQRNI